MKYLYLFIVVLCSCSGVKSDIPKLTVDFCEKYLKQTPELQSEKSVVFILNPSECRPCEEEIIQLVKTSQKDFNTIILLPNGVKQPTEIKTKKILRTDYMELARYGMLNANGSVLIFDESECVFYDPIDVQNIDRLLLKIDRFK